MTERLRKVMFLKFSNPHGQILMAYTKQKGEFHAGIAFCNPCEFNYLTRQERHVYGQRSAAGRMAKAKRCVVIPDTFEVSSDDKRIQHLELRQHLFEFIASDPCAAGVKPYYGKHNEFQKWFVPFVKEERLKIEKKLSS